MCPQTRPASVRCRMPTSVSNNHRVTRGRSSRCRPTSQEFSEPPKISRSQQTLGECRMAYSIHYQNPTDQNDAWCAQISGFFVSLPFTFDNQQNIQLMPDNAMAVVQLALVKSHDAQY